MTIAIVGTGYVGLVTGACLARLGHTVYCIDINKNKIDALNNGLIPIYEPKLESIIKEDIYNNRLFFTSSYDILKTSDAVFCCVGTPQDEDGSADVQYVLSVAKEFGQQLQKRSVIITKSTVPVGTSRHVKEIVNAELHDRNVNIEFDVVSNPEFLKEGSAIDDFMNPDRIVIGCESDYARIVMKSIYKHFDEDKILFTTISTAEMIKYAANSMLATRISFMNDIARLCDKVGANVKDIARGIGLDSRIGPKFLSAGCGYGGSCFPKDVKALIKTGDNYSVDMAVIKAVDRTNELQKHILYEKLYEAAGQVNYPIKNISILGTAFKPNTDDMREATSIVFINDLLNDKNKIGPFDGINIYDPVALNEAKRQIGESNDHIKYFSSIDEAVIDSDVIVICTEWNNIKEMSLDIVKKLMRGNIIIDGRNIFNRDNIEDLGFIYKGIGI